MSRISHLEPVFVEFIPPEAELKPGKLYISMQYGATVHLCASGCGMKVSLPITPAKWHILFDGNTVTLSDSVGNWSYPCKAHYWIINNQIVWAPSWDDKRIEAGRRNDERDVEEYLSGAEIPRRRTEKAFWDRFFQKD